MPLFTAFRRSPAVWLSPVLILIIVFFASESLYPASEYYPLALTVTGASQVFLIAPFCAACAAWEAGRIRRAGWFGFPRTRSLVSFLTLALTPTFTVGMLATIFAVLFQFRVAPSLSLPDLTVLGAALVVVLGHTLLGFGIGVHIRPVIAAPSILLVDYAWMVMLVTLEPLWLRHLTGAWTSCCDVTTSLDPRALLAVTVIAVGFVVTALVLVRVPMTGGRLMFSVVPLIVSFSIGVDLVNSLGYAPTIARSGDLVCSDGEPKVCLWPEHDGVLERVASLARQADEAWRDAGFTGPDQFSELRTDALRANAGAIRVRPNLPQFDTNILMSLAYGSLPQPPDCSRDGTTQMPGVVAAPYVAAWLGNVAGVPLATLSERFDAAVIETVEAVRALPKTDQVAWVTHNVMAIGDCWTKPQLDPSS